MIYARRLALVLLTLLSACGSTYTVRIDQGASTILAQSEEDNESVEWRLYPAGKGQPKLTRIRKTTTTVARVGVSVKMLTAERAERLGVEPWNGVAVTRVYRGSAAETAGIQKDDIILAIGETAIGSDGQFIDVVQSELRPEEPAELMILRPAVSAVASELKLTLTPTSRPVTETSTDSFALDDSPALLRRTGVQLATIPAELAAEVYGAPGAVTVVAGTVSGSAAYLAGLRGGDRVLRCNGMAVESIEEIDTIAGIGVMDEGSDELNLEVDGPLGEHRARVKVGEDIYGNARVHIPIVFNYRSNVERTRWSFLDFIFQFGANYSSSYQPSRTRETAEQWRLSLFPLGMFEFERGPNRSRTTLFWVIRFSSD